MSGRRTKALRAAFRKINGRSPVTDTQTAKAESTRRVWSEAIKKRVRETFSFRLVLPGTVNEFRRFKNSLMATARHTESKAADSGARCKSQFNRHRWQVKSDKVVCRRCGTPRNEKAGRAQIAPVKRWRKTTQAA